MARTPLTEADLQAIIHRKFEKNNDTPSSDSADYLLRRGLMCDSVEKVGLRGQEDNIRWKWLFKNLADAATGDKTTDSGSVYDAPDDFIEPATFVQIAYSTGTVTYPFKKPDQVLMSLRNNSSEQFYYVTGDEINGYKININPLPFETGKTISYGYFHAPTLFTATTSVTEMPKPYFVVYDVLSVLFEEEQPSLSNKYAQMAKSLADSMYIDNEIPPNQHGYSLNSLGAVINGSGFGK